MLIWPKEAEHKHIFIFKNEFGDIEIEKNKLYCHKTPVLLKDVDIEEVLVSKKISFCEISYKYFIDYLYNNDKVKS